MSTHPANRPPGCLRRALLHRAVTAAAAAVALGGLAGNAGAQIKISKKAVAYQDSPEGDKRCEKCIQFQPPAACKLVEGPISPQGCCRIFVLRTGSAVG